MAISVEHCKISPVYFAPRWWGSPWVGYRCRGSKN